MQIQMPIKELADVQLPDDRILILPLDADSKTHNGLILDPRHYDKFKKGAVVLIGPGKLTEDKTGRISTQLEVGDIVLFDSTMVKQININNKVFNIFTETEGLIAVVGELKETGEIELYADTKI